jgi:hypothetical protein
MDTTIRAPKGQRWLCIVEGCEAQRVGSGYCSKHYQRWKKYGDPLFLKVAEPGSGSVNGEGYRLISVSGRRIKEHRYVMEQMIGRPLHSYETVHHKNGNKLDNRPENLEIWVGNHGNGASEAHCPTCTCFNH